MNNVIFIEFYDKQNLPKGPWLSEPDLCRWEHKLSCITLRDMQMGVWKGFVGIEEKHPFYGKLVDDLIQMPEAMEIFFSVHGGISIAGRLPPKYKEYNKNNWWIGIETTHGGDLMPFLKLENSNGDMAKMLSGQTYKNFQFIRRETNKLANMLHKMQ